MAKRALFFMICGIFLIGISFIMPQDLYGQEEGCTDPYAINFNPDAIINDGSCFYEETVFTPDQYIGLPSTLAESSGLIYWNGGIWTFNDSGGDPRIYKVDTLSGEIIQHVTISNGDNVDWEDIAQDDENIYIGDFGNNSGDRKDLVIYKLDKADIPSTGNVDVTAGIISFNYSDQQTFVPSFNNNEYDCEAMISAGGFLYLFTKNWVSETSRLYKLSPDVGTHSILPIDTLESGGLVTGAAYSAELGQVVLCGYRNYIPFIFLLFDYHDHDFFTGNKRRIGISGLPLVQTEGVCFKTGYRTFLSCEESSISQQVFTFTTSEWTDTSLVSLHENQNSLNVLVHPNPVTTGEFWVDLSELTANTLGLSLYDTSGRAVFSRKYDLTPGDNSQSLHILVPELDPGVYLLHILSGNLSAKEKIIIQ